MWEPDEPNADSVPAVGPRCVGAAAALLDRRAPTSTSRPPTRTSDRIRATYGANFDRLVEVKKQYDPENLFRVNRNIPPAPDSQSEAR